jgi:hypothetical protein
MTLAELEQLLNRIEELEAELAGLRQQAEEGARLLQERLLRVGMRGAMAPEEFRTSSSGKKRGRAAGFEVPVETRFKMSLSRAKAKVSKETYPERKDAEKFLNEKMDKISKTNNCEVPEWVKADIDSFLDSVYGPKKTKKG